MVRIDDSGGEVRCWLRPDEIYELENVALSDDWTREIAVQLMGECGLRASEVSYPSDEHLRWSEAGDCWLLEGSVEKYEGRRENDPRCMGARVSCRIHSPIYSRAWLRLR